MSSLADMKASASEEASAGFRVRPHNLEAEQAAYVAACLDGAPTVVDGAAGRAALDAALRVERAVEEALKRVS